MISPRFNSVLVSVTEGCHVGCAHCGFLGSTRERESDAAELASWVASACAYGIPMIIFTGGEAFERLEVLEAGVASARGANTEASVFTSSFWATSPEVATATLRRLDGIRHLYLSSDVYHQRRVPYANVHHVIAAADRLGIPRISIVITYASDADRLAVRSEYARYGDRLRFCEERVIPTRFNQRSVRGQDALLPADPDAYAVHCWLETPIINPNGDLFACHVGKAGAHGSLEYLPYWLGNLRTSSFARVMSAARIRADYQFLRTHGPKGVADLYRAYPELAAAVGREGFTGPCDMCFSTLASEAGRTALRAHVQKADVVASISARLALLFREPPLEPGRVAFDAPSSFAMTESDHAFAVSRT